MQVQVNFAAKALGCMDSKFDNMCTVETYQTENSQCFISPIVVHTSPLTCIPLCVEFGGPYKCLVDSGSELAIAKRSVVDDLVASKRSAGQIRLQGIFG